MFSGAHLHLLANHAPIFGALFALATLLVSFFWVSASDVLRRVALLFLVFTGLAAAAANLSGDAAEDAIRGFPGVRRAVIHEHEDMGDKAYLAAGIVGVLSIGALARWRRTSIPRGAAYGALLGAAVVSGLMVYTGLLGGRVRHTEVRPAATPSDATFIEPRPARPPGAQP